MNNDRHNQFYPIRIRYITVLVVSGIALISYIFPRFFTDDPTISSQTKTEIIETFDLPDTPPEIIPPKPVTPSIPVSDETEWEDENITIKSTQFEDYKDWEKIPEDKIPEGGIPQVIFKVWEKAPEPVGGFAALARNVVYPALALEAGIYGTVIVETLIDENGDVIRMSIVKGLDGTGLNQAAMDAIKKTEWKSARQRDKAVAVLINIPIRFTLD